MNIDTSFVPLDLDGTSWSALEPLYLSLRDRTIDDAADLERLLLDRSELDAHVSEAGNRLYAAMTCDTTDNAIEAAYLKFVEEVSPPLQQISFEIDQRVADSPFLSDLSEHFDVLSRDTKASVKLFKEENVPLLVEDTKMGQQFGSISGVQMVEFEGESRTMPWMGTIQEDTNRDRREAAWRASWGRRIKDREALDGLYDAMISNRTKIGVNAGYENYVGYAFASKQRFDYTPDDCKAFHQAAEDIFVPLLRKIHEDRRQQLGLDTLRPWDLAVDASGRAPLRPFRTEAELVQGCSKMFTALDPELGELFTRLQDGTSLDLESRPGKAPGGYQLHLDRQRKVFIFMNAAGTHDDLQTMLHESGHAFHAMLSEHEELVHYRHSPIEFAEVASMAMEKLAATQLGMFYAPQDAARAWRGHLEDCIRSITWVATIDAFQHEIYRNPNLGREGRTALWLDLDQRFGVNCDWSGLEDIRQIQWQRQLHLFEVPFYYIEYGIAQLGALQLWRRSTSDHAGALNDYKSALRLGGSKPLPELFEAAGIPFDFSPETVRRVGETVASELEALPL